MCGAHPLSISLLLSVSLALQRERWISARNASAALTYSQFVHRDRVNRSQTHPCSLLVILWNTNISWKSFCVLRRNMSMLNHGVAKDWRKICYIYFIWNGPFFSNEQIIPASMRHWINNRLGRRFLSTCTHSFSFVRSPAHHRRTIHSCNYA